PRVLVVMATHDRPAGLARQLDALRAQTLSDDAYEIIVVDDGSGPETIELLEREKARSGPSLSVIRHEPAGGPARARNAGWLIARGYEPVWAPAAVMYHAVTKLDVRAKLRLAWRWDETMLIFKRHPELRRHMTFRLFWNNNHWLLIRAAIALALPSRLWWLRW